MTEEQLRVIVRDELRRIEVERSIFDLSKTVVDVAGNTLLFDRYRGEYVNCGKQNN